MSSLRRSCDIRNEGQGHSRLRNDYIDPEFRRGPAQWLERKDKIRRRPWVRSREKDEINVPMALSVFRDGTEVPGVGGNGTYLIPVELPLLSPE